MSQSLEGLRRKITGAGDLKSVVRTMKALAAASIGQYEKAVRSLGDYYRTVDLGLSVCLRETQNAQPAGRDTSSSDGVIGAVVFGSDQGLVGQFNEEVARFAAQQLGALPGSKTVWTVGERVQERLRDEGFSVRPPGAVPNSVNAITRLVAQVLLDLDKELERGRVEQVFLFHNRPKSGAAYEPVSQRLLPLDAQWRRELKEIQWPTKSLPQVMDSTGETLAALVREYLFVSLFKACAESLASENASRLAAMQRAEKNIDDLLEDLGRTFHRARQSSIDEELFDLVSGFEALSSQGPAITQKVTRTRSTIT